jgi:hypothetical protein
MAAMKTAIESNTGAQLWGIYYRDRKCARITSDPLRTVISAQSKEEAEQEASGLGFEQPWANPVMTAEAILAHWLPVKRQQTQGTTPERRGTCVRV